MSKPDVIAGPQAGPKSRHLALIVSLACNLVFIAILGAHLIVMDRPGPPPGPPSLAHMVDHMCQELSPSDAEKVRAVFDRDRVQLEALDQDAQAARQGIEDAMKRRPFDAEALRAATLAWRTKRSSFDTMVDADFLEIAASVSDDGHDHLARFFTHRKEGPGGPPGPGGHDQLPPR